MPIAWLIAVLACTAADTDVPTDTDTPGDTDVTAVTGTAKIWRECGPADGAALILAPAQPSDVCDTTWDPAPKGAWIYVYRDLPDSAPAVIAIGADYGSAATATYCPDHTTASCVDAVGGEVRFTAYEVDSTAVGTWRLDLPDGGSVGGDFDAGWCESTPVCG
jgi:hypothetical protein